MKEESDEDFTTYEDDIITLLNKLSETIETFNTLSREQAENAILETNIKISSCKEILGKMEQYINNLNDEEEIEKAELNKKLLNYRSEYNEILNKYNEIQDNYINKKAENALMEDQNISNLVDEEENNKKSINRASGAGDPYAVDGELNDSGKKFNKENKKEMENNEINNSNKLRNKNENNKNENDITLISAYNNDKSMLDHNNSNIIGYGLNPNKEKEEAFHEINRDYDKKKKKTILICICICIFIFLMIVLIALLSK